MWITIGLCLVCAFLVVPSISRRQTGARPLFKNTGSHWKRNYSRRSFLRLGGALAAAGILAYSGIDEAVESWHTGSVRSAGTDRFSHYVKFFGERFWFLNWALVGAVDAWLKSNSFSRWGRQNFEAMVVGLPVLWTVQRGLGANRPSSDDGSPRWRPLNAANSASGHAFIAAIPWMNLARRSGWQPARWAGWVGSTLTGWSRMNDRKHYLSQVILGWTIAWNATSAVDDQGQPSDKPESVLEGPDHAAILE